MSNQCPQCRIHIGSLRLLRASKSLDGIIKLLVDDIDAFNAQNAVLREAKLREMFNSNQILKDFHTMF